MNALTKRNTRTLAVCLAALIGGALFILIYGYRVINPAYTDWIMQGSSDLQQGYFGWRFFQNSPWLSPIGMMNTLTYPDSVSIVATDSIPLLALLFKFMKPFLPHHFYQYFGLWGLMCFMLQGALGTLLCGRYARSAAQTALGGALFVPAPILLDKLFAHSALAGQWVILLALLPLVYYDTVSRRPDLTFFAWFFLGCLAAAIHSYFVVMCGVVCVGYCVLDTIKNKRWYGFFSCVVFILGALGVSYLLGGFAGSPAEDIDDFGRLGYNLNGFLNPKGYSRFMLDLPTHASGNTDDLAYLGYGVLMLCVLSIVFLARTYFMEKASFRDDLRAHRTDVAALCTIVLLSLLLALSPTVMWGNRTLFSVRLPQKLLELWRSFPVTARFIWPVVYLIILGAVALLVRRQGGRFAVVVLACCLCLQCFDVGPGMKAKREIYSPKAQYTSPLTEDYWALLRGRKVKRLMISPPLRDSWAVSSHLYPLAEVALTNGWTLNGFYFDQNQNVGDKWKEAIQDPQEDMIFVFTVLDIDELMDNADNFTHLYEFDGLYIGMKTADPALPLPKADLTKAHYVYDYPVGLDILLEYGEVIDGVRYIRDGGTSYGPYIPVPAGEYKIRISGENLDKAEFDCVINYGDVEIDMLDVRVSPTEITYIIALEEPVKNLETRMFNHSPQVVAVTAINISAIE